MEENKDISKIAFEKIREKGIKPISKNIFNLKRVLIWSFAGFAVLIGIVSFAVTLSNLSNNDWFLVDKFGYSFIFQSLPYFWFFCLVVFATLGEYYYRKTYMGYRHRIIMVIGAYVVVTVVFGVILHLFSLGEKIEETIQNNIPIYKNITFNKNAVWSQPEQGLLSGRIIGINGDAVTIIDLNNNTWTINKADAKISPKTNIKIGEIIKIIGDKDNDNDAIFNANKINPWKGTKPKK